MPCERYALDAKGPARLEVSWASEFIQYEKDLTIRLDDEVIGTFPSREDLLTGQQLRLPDGTVLAIQLDHNKRLLLLHESRPLPGTPDPLRDLKWTYAMFFLLGALRLLQGLWLILLQGKSFTVNLSPAFSFAWEKVNSSFAYGLGTGPLLFGLVYLALGFFVRYRSARALYLSIGVSILHGIFGVIEELQWQGSLGLYDLFSNTLLAGGLVVLAFESLRALRTLERTLHRGT